MSDGAFVIHEEVERRIAEALRTGARELSLEGFRLAELPQSIASLTQLQTLDLRGNQLRQLPAEIGRLKCLRSLDVRYNQLIELPKEIVQLQRLDSLLLCGNQLNQLPAEIVQLQNLLILDLGNNRLTELPAEIVELLNLRSLELSVNQLSELPAKIVQLNSLELLNLGNNQLSRVPAEVFQFLSLKLLDLRGNQLVELPREISQLHRLKMLYLGENQFSRFPRELLRHDELHGLMLSGNPIKDCPAEILGTRFFDNCLEAARAHFADVDKGREQDRELKLIVLGNGRVGKTSVLKRLIHDTFDPAEKSTHGIRLEVWDQLKLAPDHVRINVWDFGGQDIYHGTHALFLKIRAVFLIVWDKNTEEQSGYEEDDLWFENLPLQYWVDYVRHVNPGAPIIVVENKCDDGHPSKPPADMVGLQQISFSASNKNGHDCEVLTAHLKQAVERELDRAGSLAIGVGRWNVKQVLRSYMDVENNGDTEELTRRTISHDHFLDLCDNENGNVSSPDELLRFFHSTGVLYHQNELFCNQIILDQRWAIEAIYTIFHREGCYNQLRRLGGRFTRSDLHELAWQESALEEQKLFLSFMESCSICFRVNSGDDEEPEYIAPELLPARVDRQQEIDRWLRAVQGSDRIYYQYRHKFLHQGLMQRFIVRAGKEFGESALYWRDGLAIETSGGRAVAVVDCERRVGGDPAQGEITICVQGDLREALLNRFRKAFDLLHNAPTDVSQFVSLDAEEWVDMAKLPNYMRLGNQILTENDVAIDAQPFRFLLHRDSGERFVNSNHNQTIVGMSNLRTPIYLSYAWDDEKATNPSREEIVDKLYLSLCDAGYDVRRDKKDLEYKGRISEFMSQIGQSECIIVVISDKYLRSRYCMFELYEVHRNLNFHQRICPIVLSDAKIHDLTSRIGYVQFWNEKSKELDDLTRQTPNLSVVGSLPEAEDVRKISHNIDELISFVADMNTLTPDLIEANNFDELKRAVEERLGELT